jgi:flagellin
MLTINTNVPALNAQLALNQNTREIARLSRILIAANEDGSTNVGLDGLAGSLVPNYLTAEIRGTSQALANTDQAKQLVQEVQSPMVDIIDALNLMKNASTQPDFETAQSRLSSAISSADYNGRSLYNGETLQFQVGPNQKDKIKFTLPNLNNDATLALTYSVSGSDPNNAIDAALALVNNANGSVTAMISRLGFVKSRLETNYDRSVDYRSNILSDAVASANAKLATQRMLQSVAEAMLAQANASSQGVLALIASTRIN